ncbi:MAG: Vitamin transporter BtuB precursor [Pseudomonadota bacterium]
MNRRICMGAAVLLLLATRPAWAQEVVITATRIPTLASSVIPAVSVYAREDIEASGAWSLADLIARTPGVETGRNGGQGAVTSFFLRGAESKNVLVLVDGQRMRDGVTQSSLAENIPLELVERVEVIRGNVSALYGDGAVGGVILVTTRPESEGRAQKRIVFGMGTQGTRELGVTMRTPLSGAQIHLGLSHVAEDGASATDPSKTMSTDPSDADRDPYERTAIQVGLQAHALGGRLQLSQQSTRAHIRFDNDWMGSDPRQASSSDLTGLQWSGPFVSRYQQSLSFQSSEHRIATNTGSNNTTQTEQAGWSISGPFGDGRMLAGLERRRDARSPADGDTASRVTQAQFFTWIYDSSSSRVSAQLAIRRDDPEDLAPKSTYLLGLGWRLNATARLTASVSSAFRVPDGYALSTNPQLVPEDTRSAELGYRWVQPSGAQISLIAFQGRTNNPILYDETYTARNLSEMRNRGVEMDATLPLDSNWQLRLGLTAQDPRSPRNEFGAVVEPLVWVQSARRARWFGDLALQGRWQRYNLAFKASGAGARRNTDSDAHALRQLNGYALLSLRAQRPLGHGLSVQLTFDNLLDTEYSLAAGYPGMGRRALLSLRWRG